MTTYHLPTLRDLARRLRRWRFATFTSTVSLWSRGEVANSLEPYEPGARNHWGKEVVPPICGGRRFDSIAAARRLLSDARNGLNSQRNGKGWI